MLPEWSDANFEFAVRYLSTYGYLARDVSNDETGHMRMMDLSKPLRKFQKFFGLPETGELDAQTFRAMLAPRCACPDVPRSNREEHASYLAALEVARQSLPAWRKRGLKYAITSFVGGIPQATQQRLIAEAFAAWTRHGNIDASPAGRNETPDIIIDTGSGRRSGFDGPGGTLAWAYLPNGSDRQLNMRFDLSETWLESPGRRGILYFNVACHEIGHLFGLDHSRVNTALMAPYYNPAVAVPQPNDDIPRFQARYGKRTTPVPTTAEARSDAAEPHRIVVTIPSGTPYFIEIDGRNVS